ncbi:MAG: hypothetical protein M3220_09775 [Chloroflexota bacterium]|nr:hypothetical protein [Chloroflexota bacterium]
MLTYEHHRDRVEGGVVAAGLAWLVGIFLREAGAFPHAWQTMIPLAVFVLGTWARAWGYYAAVAVLLWPLWLLSPYLMTFFLAITVLPQKWIIDALPWALLVASAPLLAEWQMVGMVTLLAGLLVGATAGWWAGVFTALWLKVVAALCGWVPEIGALYGASFALDLIRSRVVDATLLEIVALVVEPFSQSPSLLFLHVVQIGAWGLAGWLVGKVRQIDWRNEEPLFPFAPALAPGVLVLWVAMFVVPAWLGFEPLTRFLTYRLPTVGLAVSALAAALLTTVAEDVLRPVHPTPRRGAIHTRHRGRVEASNLLRRNEHIRPESSMNEDEVIGLEVD